MIRKLDWFEFPQKQHFFGMFFSIFSSTSISRVYGRSTTFLVVVIIIQRGITNCSHCGVFETSPLLFNDGEPLMDVRRYCDAKFRSWSEDLSYLVARWLTNHALNFFVTFMLSFVACWWRGARLPVPCHHGGMQAWMQCSVDQIWSEYIPLTTTDLAYNPHAVPPYLIHLIPSSPTFHHPSLICFCPSLAPPSSHPHPRSFPSLSTSLFSKTPPPHLYSLHPAVCISYVRQSCIARIEKSKEGDCEAWYFDYMKCIDKCRVPQIFKTLK